MSEESKATDLSRRKTDCNLEHHVTAVMVNPLTLTVAIRVQLLRLSARVPRCQKLQMAA